MKVFPGVPSQPGMDGNIYISLINFRIFRVGWRLAGDAVNTSL